MRFTQTPSSQPAPTPEPTQDTNLDSSQLFAARPRPHLSDIVPDSQRSSGEESFVPTTHRTEDVTQQSTDTNESQMEEDLAEESLRIPLSSHPQLCGSLTLLSPGQARNQVPLFRSGWKLWMRGFGESLTGRRSLR